MLCLFICLIASLKVALGVLINHVNEMVIISEESMDWLPDRQTAHPSSGDASKDRDDKGCQKAVDLSSCLVAWLSTILHGWEVVVWETFA